MEGYIKISRGRVWYKKIGRGDTPLLVIHGGPGYPHDYLKPLEKLAVRQPVIFYDQLGCGNSDGFPNKKYWTVKIFTDQLEELVKKLKLKNFCLLGHSWGASLAASYALRQPKGLKKIIFVSPFFNAQRWARDIDRLKKKLPLKIQQIIRKNERLHTTDSPEYYKAIRAFDRLFVLRMKKPKPVQASDNKTNASIYEYMYGPSEFNCSGSLKNFNITNKLHCIKQPVLILCGKYDEATPESAKKFRKLFLNADLKIFEHSSHASF